MSQNLIKTFQERGYFSQCTDLDNLNKLLNNKKIKLYIGFDCTAPSLHVGSLVQIMCLRLFQNFGHTPIVLLGGGTTMIGDPSGKEESRKILTSAEIKKNTLGIKKVFNKFLNNKGNNKFIFLNNEKWLTKINYINFLRDCGKHFTINKMLTFDSVKLRLDREQSLSFLEFNYMILQAYDYLELNKKNECVLQIGGSDQWGNIVNGIELIRRVYGKESYGLTTPLITTSSGAKMGKTEKGAVWLDEKQTSPYEYWQFWRNVNDADVFKYLRLFTELPINKIADFENDKSRNINNFKIILANEATKILHGEKASSNAEATSKKTFQDKSFGDDLPKIEIKKSEFHSGISFNELIIKINFAKSNGEFRRNISNKVYRINNEIVLDEKKIVTQDDFKGEKIIKISFGKKQHVLIEAI
jgi:tyrosyl-tRNA synthetase